MTCLSVAAKGPPLTVKEYKQMVANRQQFRDLSAKRWHKASPLNPILLPKTSKSTGFPCTCELLQIEAEEYYKIDPEIKKNCGCRSDMLPLQDLRHNTFVLYDEMLKHLHQNDRYSTEQALRATSELRTRINDCSNEDHNLMIQLGFPNARSMDVNWYKDLLELLSDMFFPGTMWFYFEFMPPEEECIAYADCALMYDNQEGHNCGRIRLSPTLIEWPAGRVPDSLADQQYYRAIFRLGLLLHELCHAYLQKYSCRKCHDREEQIDQFEGHGWAWQRIAARVESMVQLKLGLRLCLGKFSMVQNNWDDVRVWPSVEEVEQWDLQDARTWPTDFDMVGYREYAERKDLGLPKVELEKFAQLRGLGWKTYADIAKGASEAL